MFRTMATLWRATAQRDDRGPGASIDYGTRFGDLETVEVPITCATRAASTSPLNAESGNALHEGAGRDINEVGRNALRSTIHDVAVIHAR